ncbi:MAG: hypothetical protein ACYC8V_06190 [Caulobacteraceae bacterium]
MRELIDVHGASGAVYRFSLFREGRPLSPMGGNFLYVREEEDGPGKGYEIVHVGEGQNLLTDAHLDWDKAVGTHAVSHLFTRLNISERTRKQEHADIVRALHPPMESVPAEKRA